MIVDTYYVYIENVVAFNFLKIKTKKKKKQK